MREHVESVEFASAAWHAPREAALKFEVSQACRCKKQESRTGKGHYCWQTCKHCGFLLCQSLGVVYTMILTSSGWQGTSPNTPPTTCSTNPAVENGVHHLIGEAQHHAADRLRCQKQGTGRVIRANGGRQGGCRRQDLSIFFCLPASLLFDSSHIEHHPRSMHRDGFHHQSSWFESATLLYLSLCIV